MQISPSLRRSTHYPAIYLDSTLLPHYTYLACQSLTVLALYPKIREKVVWFVLSERREVYLLSVTNISIVFPI